MFARREQNQAKKPDREKTGRRDSALDGKDAPEQNSVWQSLAMRAASIQPKHAIGQPDDPNGSEAGHVTNQSPRRSHSEQVREGGILQPLLAAGNPALQSDIQSEQDSAQPRGSEDPERIHEAAAAATSGPSRPLPFLDQIQRSFGTHDLSQIRAHLDPAAAEGAAAMGAEAFTIGDHVAFAGSPNLRTAAHEAAHVIQQRSGVQVVNGIGRKDDEYELHADAVAERVVQQRSSEDLLNDFISEVQTKDGARERSEAEDDRDVSATEMLPEQKAQPTAFDGITTGRQPLIRHHSIERTFGSGQDLPTPNTHTRITHMGPGAVEAGGVPDDGGSSRGPLAVSRVRDAARQEAYAMAGGAAAGALALTGSALAIQRQPGPHDKLTGASTVIEYEVGDITSRVWASEGLLLLSLRGEPWVTVRWTPRGNTTPRIALQSGGFPQSLSVDVSASFDLKVTVYRTTESDYADRFLGDTSIVHSYVAGGHQVTINEHLPNTTILMSGGSYIDFKKYNGHDILPNPSIENLPNKPTPKPKDRTPFWWEFDRIEQFDLVASAQPNYFWMAIRPQEGHLRSLNLTEEDLQKAADKFRESEDLAASVLKLYEKGKPWPEVSPLYYMFFNYWGSAEKGAPGDAPECLIYTHNTSSFGRKDLTHEEALSEWKSLEKLHTESGAGAVAAMMIDGIGPFFELVAVGRSGTEWNINREYFELRDVFLANVKARRAGAGQSWSDLFAANQAVWLRYLRAALDRDEWLIDPELAEVIDYDSSFVSEAGGRVYEEVKKFASGTAANAARAAQNGISIYLERDKLQGLVLQFPFMDNKQRYDALTFLGVSPVEASFCMLVLSDPQRAQMVAMGEDVMGVSLDWLGSFVKKQNEELEKAILSFTWEGVEALSMEGDFGDQIREVTYKHFGFNLDPKRYPHEGAERFAGQRVKPADAISIFGSEAGFLYAQHTASLARTARRWKWIKLAIAVVAAVALVILTAGLAAPLAGLLFSTATTAGLIAFTVTEVVISAAIITAVGPAVNTFIMSGGSLDPELYRRAYSGLGWQFLINLGTFGFFKVLGMGIRAAAVIGAGGEEAFMASRGWQAANTVGRIGLSGASMFAFSVVSHRLQTGDWPKGESMAEIIFETGLSIILLEVGSFLARPFMERLQKAAEAQRIGADVLARMKNLRIEVRKLNMAAAEFGTNPLGGQKTGTDLLARQRAVLNEQKALLEKLKESFRTSPDAKALEKILAGEMAEIDARVSAINGVEAFAKAEVRPAAAGGTGEVAEFTYKRGHEQELKDYYGEKNVRTVGDHLEVDFQGKTLIFRPATDAAAGILPDGTRNPDALKAWRSTATSRMAKIVKRAGDIGADDKALRDVAKADPNSMDAEAMRAFEKQLQKAENLLDKLEKAGPNASVSIERGGDGTEAWRQRLAAERDRVVARAKLLGVENAIEVDDISRMPMNRSGLKENTLNNYKEAIDKARKLVDGKQAEKLKALDLATGGPPADVDVLQSKLGARREDVLRRAKVYGAGGRDYIEAVKSLRVGSRNSYESLSDAEASIARAEGRLDDMAKKALAKGVDTHGADVVAKVRAGAGLEKMSDAQVGDVMRQLGGAGKLSPEALRGAMQAYIAPEAQARSPIPLDKMVRLARSPAELEFMLESFGKLRDAQVGGSFDLLRDAVGSPGKWKGGVWQMELARYVIGIDKVRAFEVRVTTESGGRDIDIVLHDGKVIEAKDWSEWQASKVDEQFFKDLEHNTKNGTDPTGLEKIRWMFRSPPPISVAKIRAAMRVTMERFITKKGLLKGEADALRDAFDAHTKLVEVPKIDRTQVVTPSPGWNPPPPPPKKEDDK